MHFVVGFKYYFKLFTGLTTQFISDCRRPLKFILQLTGYAFLPFICYSDARCFGSYRCCHLSSYIGRTQYS